MNSGQVLLMRHAEKSADPHDPNLTPDGVARADRLPDYIKATFGTPSFLFASAESKHSRRPIETLEPLSIATGLTIDTSFADQDYSALAHQLLEKDQYEDKLSIVCWHHGNIPSLAHALGLPDRAYPDPWDRGIFNLILAISFRSGVPSVQLITEPF
jgi:broad specificity phosphatase PhoE